MVSVAQFLKSVRIFETLTEEELNLLAPQFQIRNVKGREQVISEGNVSSVFYVIRAGHFNVTKGDKGALVTVLGPKDHFGEASLFHDVPRSANITAADDGQLLMLHRDQFLQFLLSYPIAANRILFQMLKEVFLRLVETTQLIL